MTAHQTDRVVTYNKLLYYLYSDIFNSIILLFNHIPTTYLLIYWSVVLYYNGTLLRLISLHAWEDTRSRSMRDPSQDKPRSWQCQIWLRLSTHPSLTGTLAGFPWVPMTCQTIWSKKAWNRLIKIRYPLRKEPRKSQDTSCLTRHDLDLTSSMRSRSPISSQRFWLDCLTRHDLDLTTSMRSRPLISIQRFWLDFHIHRRKLVLYCLTWRVSVFKT